MDFIQRDENGEPNEQDIMAISAAILPDEAVGNDPFWSRISRLVLETSIAYVLEYTSDTTLTSVADLLAVLTSRGARGLHENPVRVNFHDLAERKTAEFLNVSDSDPSQYKPVSLFYTQILHTLCDYADRCPGNRLTIPVRLYLDDLPATSLIRHLRKPLRLFARVKAI